MEKQEVCENCISGCHFIGGVCGCSCHEEKKQEEICCDGCCFNPNECTGVCPCHKPESTKEEKKSDYDVVLPCCCNCENCVKPEPTKEKRLACNDLDCKRNHDAFNRHTPHLESPKPIEDWEERLEKLFDDTDWENVNTVHFAEKLKSFIRTQISQAEARGYERGAEVHDKTEESDWLPEDIWFWGKIIGEGSKRRNGGTNLGGGGGGGIEV